MIMQYFNEMPNNDIKRMIVISLLILLLFAALGFFGGYGFGKEVCLSNCEIMINQSLARCIMI